jgi:hypothetical protein
MNRYGYVAYGTPKLNTPTRMNPRNDARAIFDPWQRFHRNNAPPVAR